MKKIIAMIILTVALGACTANEDLPDESVLERYARGLQKRYNLKVNTEGDKGKANDICSKAKVFSVYPCFCIVFPTNSSACFTCLIIFYLLVYFISFEGTL